jgi:hypothetical protein
MDERVNSALSRRGFLAGAGLVALGAGVGLTGCNSEGGSAGSTDADKNAVSFDRECDLLVCGSGTAVVAALAAAEFGAESVILIEKSDVFGGTSAMSGGGVGIPLTYVAKAAGIQDSEEAVLTYYKNATVGRADESVVKSYITNGNAFLEWTRDTYGFTWDFSSLAFHDYYEPCEGFLAYGRGSISVGLINGEPNSEPRAVGVWAVYREAVDNNDKIELIMNTAATSLITDEQGAVLGAVITSEGKELRVGAKKGVILGTGGFDHNDEMRKDYLPYPLLVTNASPGNTGDAHIMGMRIGAALSHMDRSWGLPSFLTGNQNPDELVANNQIVYDFSGNDYAHYRGRPGVIVVNRAGKRIGDEAQAYDVFNRDFGRFSSKAASFPNIPSFFICGASYSETYTLPRQSSKDDPIPDFYVQADTIEELAQKLGIDAAGLTAEIESFNAAAREGRDPVFDRGAKSIDVNSSGLYSGSRTDIPNPCLLPVEGGPYYGATYVPGTLGTNGGLKIDANSQVRSVTGEPIKGLYAVGNCSAGVSGGAYCHGGMTVGAGCVMSYVAARHALGVA